MKKSIVKLLFTITLSSTLLITSSCANGCNVVELLGGYTYYTISYRDDEGSHSFTVESGKPFSIESIPQREGYDFVGLFDAETCGTQYVSSDGNSVITFSDEPDNFITLYPRFTPKEYKVVLNYEGATSSGVSELTAYYDSQLPMLPVDLSLNHYEFEGWFTESNCQGLKVADKNGLAPLSSIVNFSNFELNTSTINLYAGFSLEKFIVTFNFGNNFPIETMDIDYNTPISQVVPETRDLNGYAVLTWSTSEDGSNIFNANITSDITLYAVEWAPVIEFDVNGGDYIAPLVAKEGTNITLPTPIRDNFKFIGWNTSNGNNVNITQMPANSLSLKASWLPLIQLESNAGSSVADICESQGTAISLPEPTRSGYMFAGWFTDDNKPYYTTIMPAVGVKLKAGWCKAKEANITILASDESVSCSSTDLKFNTSLTINLRNYLPEEFYGHVDMTIKWKVSHDSNLADKTTVVSFYSRNQLSNQYLLASKSTTVDSSDYTNVSIEIHAQLQTNMVYVATASDMTGNLMLGSRYYGRVADMSVELIYPDMSTLYL